MPSSSCSVVLSLSLALVACGKSEPAPPSPTASAPPVLAGDVSTTASPMTSDAVLAIPETKSPEAKPAEAKAPAVRARDDGEVDTEGLPAISADGRIVAFLETSGDEREGDVVTELVLWDLVTGARRTRIVVRRPGMDSHLSEDEAKAALALCKAAIGEGNAELAKTTWRPLVEAGDAEVVFEGADLIVRAGDREILREPHPEWLVDAQPPCAGGGEEELEPACGCVYTPTPFEPMADPDKRRFLMQISYPTDHHCDAMDHPTLWHVATVAPSGSALDPTTARWTVQESVALLCRSGKDKLPDDVLASRRAFVRSALSTPAALAAVWDAMSACGQPGEPNEPKADVTWEVAAEADKYGAGIAADGKSVALRTVDCDRLDKYDETFVVGPSDHAGKRKKTTHAKADAIAPPLEAVAGVRLVVGASDVGEEHVTWHRLGGLSLLSIATCELPAAARAKPAEEVGALDYLCTLRVLARPADGGPGATLDELVEEFFYDPREAVFFARKGVDAFVLGRVKGGDHGCGTFDLDAWSGPKDVAATLNGNAVKALKAGRLADARRGFEAALAIDPTATLARYNLACAHARSGDAEASVAALGPLLADAKERARWLARIEKDKDFDGIRTSDALVALLAPPQK